MTEIVFSTASALARVIRQQQVTASDVLEAHLAQIAKYNPALNAVVTLYADDARRRAQQADVALARGEVWGPLLGVPVTLKSVHSVAGALSPWVGHPEYATRIPTEDSAMPVKVRQAGAVIMGMTNSHILANNIFGRTNNPWDVERSPNGSSAGSAAAVAAGLSPLDIGDDGLGSILQPASFCGVFGLRPTEHRVSNAGSKVFGTPHIFQPFTVFGPLTRSVEDLELALQVIAGPDGRDMDVPPVPWRAAKRIQLKGLRLAWSHTFPKMPLAQEIHDALERLAAELSQLGAHTQQTMPELDYIQAHDLGWTLLRMTWEDFFRANGWIAPEVPPFRLDDFYKAVVQREAFVRIWEHFFTDWDVFLCPIDMTTATRHTDTGLVVDGKDCTGEEVSHSTRSISPLTGLPSVAIPIGLDSHGLPMSAQLIGRRWEDERLLAITKLVSQVAGGFQKPPGY